VGRNYLVLAGGDVFLAMKNLDDILRVEILACVGLILRLPSGKAHSQLMKGFRWIERKRQ